MRHIFRCPLTREISLGLPQQTNHLSYSEKCEALLVLFPLGLQHMKVLMCIITNI